MQRGPGRTLHEAIIQSLSMASIVAQAGHVREIRLDRNASQPSLPQSYASDLVHDSHDMAWHSQHGAYLSVRGRSPKPLYLSESFPVQP